MGGKGKNINNSSTTTVLGIWPRLTGMYAHPNYGVPGNGSSSPLCKSIPTLGMQLVRSTLNKISKSLPPVLGYQQSRDGAQGGS